MVIYDSLPSICIDKRTREQIAAILQCTEYREIKVTVPSVQRQNGLKDCGLFALAFAMSICAGQDPSTCSYIQHKFRSHLLLCLEKNVMSLFPTRLRTRCPGPSQEYKFPIYCLCRQPSNEGRMVECSSCKEWYHKECEQIPEDVWTDKDYFWSCSRCKK